MDMATKDHSQHELGFLQEEKLQNQILGEEEGNEGENGKNVNGDDDEGKNNEKGNGKVMWSEKERRKKIGTLFTTLHDLLPHLPSKANKSSIIDETICYIESLKQTLEKLEKQKKERVESLLTYNRRVHQSSIMNSSSQWNQPKYDSTNANGNYSNTTSTSTIPSIPTTQLAAFETWSSPNLVLNICGNEAQFSILATKKPNMMTTIALVLEKHHIDVISASILGNAHGNQYTILAQANGTTSYQTTSVGEIYKQAAQEIIQWIT